MKTRSSILCNRQGQGQFIETVMNSEKGYINIINNTTVEALVVQLCPVLSKEHTNH